MEFGWQIGQLRNIWDKKMLLMQVVNEPHKERF